MADALEQKAVVPAAVNPWYREPWPWIIIGSIGVVVIACFVTLGIAFWSYDGLVADDYYKKGLTINRTLERENRAVALGLTAQLAVLPDGTVRVALHSTDVSFAPPPAMQLRLAHSRYPDQDRDVSLALVESGIYSGHLVPPQSGRWRVSLEGDDWRLPTAEARAPLGEMTLMAGIRQ